MSKQPQAKTIADDILERAFNEMLKAVNANKEPLPDDLDKLLDAWFKKIYAIMADSQYDYCKAELNGIFKIIRDCFGKELVKKLVHDIINRNFTPVPIMSDCINRLVDENHFIPPTMGDMPKLLR